jgi:hypothetical protein
MMAHNNPTPAKVAPMPVPALATVPTTDPQPSIAVQLGWTETPAEKVPVNVRGASDELRAFASFLIATSPTAQRRLASEVSEDELKVLGRLLSAKGYRFKDREGTFPHGPEGTLKTFRVISAIKRTPKPPSAS